MNSDKYQVVVLVNSKEIIVRDFKSTDNSPYQRAMGFLLQTTLVTDGSTWLSARLTFYTLEICLIAKNVS